MEKTEKIYFEDLKSPFPNDFKALKRVYYLEGNKRVDVMCFAQDGFIYCGSDIEKDLDYYVEYISFDESKINKCLDILKRMYHGYDEYFYRCAIDLSHMESWYNNHEKIGDNHTYHKICLERLETYFKRIDKQFKIAMNE